MASATRVNAVDRYLTRHIDAGRAGQRALVAGDATWTYGALHEQVQRAAWVLREMGVARGERVMILLPDSPIAVAFLLGAIAVGAAPAAIPTQMREAEHAFICSDCEPRVAIVDAAHARRMVKVRAASGWPREILLAGGAATAGEEDPLDGDQTPVQNDFPRGLVTVNDALARAELAETVPVNRDDMALLQYTSGSTGRPKGVVHLHRGLLALPDGFGARLALRDTDLCYSTAKLSFGYGMGNSVFFPLAAGAAVLLRGAPSDPLGVLATIDAARPTVVFSGPTLYGAIAAIRGAERAFDLSGVRLYVSAGDVLSAALFRRWRERFGREILDGLGSTECLHIFIAGRVGSLRAGRVGEAVAPYRVRLVDDDGRTVQPGVAGHLEVSGPSNGARYWNRAQETETTMAGGWIRTGDLLEWDPDAGFRYLGRSDDVFKVRELKVSPVEVEELLNLHPAVAESAVVGRADANGLTEVCAFVRPAPGCEPGPELARELRTELRERLAPHKLPRAFEFVEALPRTSTGKLARHALRAKRSATQGR